MTLEENFWEREMRLGEKMLRKNRFSVVPPFSWYGPDPEPLFDSIEEKFEYISDDLAYPIDRLYERLDDYERKYPKKSEKVGRLRRTLGRVRQP